MVTYMCHETLVIYITFHTDNNVLFFYNLGSQRMARYSRIARIGWLASKYALKQSVDTPPKIFAHYNCPACPR